MDLTFEKEEVGPVPLAQPSLLSVGLRCVLFPCWCLYLLPVPRCPFFFSLPAVPFPQSCHCAATCCRRCAALRVFRRPHPAFPRHTPPVSVCCTHCGVTVSVFAAATAVTRLTATALPCPALGGCYSHTLSLSVWLCGCVYVCALCVCVCVVVNTVCCVLCVRFCVCFVCLLCLCGVLPRICCTAFMPLALFLPRMRTRQRQTVHAVIHVLLLLLPLL